MLLSDVILAKLKRNAPIYSREIELSDKLDRLQQGKIVTGATNLKVAFTYDITTGSTDIAMFGPAGAPFKFEVIDAFIQPRGASTGGTVKIQNVTDDITDAMTCAVDKTMDRAASIDNDYAVVEKNAKVTIVCAGSVVASTIGLLTVLAIAKD